MIKTSSTLAFNIDSTLNSSGNAQRGVGEATTFDGTTAYIQVPFRVRKLSVRATVSYFLTGGAPFVRPDSILQLWSNIGGTMAPVIFVHHDQEVLNGVTYQYNTESMIDVRGTYVFQLRDLTGATPQIHADPNVAPQLKGTINVLIDFSA